MALRFASIPWTGRTASIPLLGTVNPANYPIGYVPALDGMRGLMAIGTLSAHTDLNQFGGAAVYMDIFYAMSGYLITSLLIVDYRKHGKIDLKKFYVRRIKRLYPALAVVVGGVVVLCWFFSTQFKARLIEATVAFFYLTNYWHAGRFSHGNFYYFPHTWSLAVEEQFYLLWPVTFIVLLRFFGLSWKTVAAVLALAAGFTVWRIYLTYIDTFFWWLFFSFDTRADSLLLGCALGIILKLVDLRDYPQLSRFLALSLLPLFCLEVACAVTISWESRSWYFYVSPLFGAIPGIICIAGLVQPNRTLMHQVYEHPIPVYFGRICYGLYLYHYPIFQLVKDYAPPQYVQLVVFVVGWPLSFIAATASYYLVERHFMRARPV
jgi:peptidoglycan/LPS O-acetylase OafA/YrhL